MTAFITWCARDQGRIDGVLGLGDSNDVPETALTGALVAGMQRHRDAYFPVAADWLKGHRRSRRPGTVAFCQMDTQDKAAVLQAIRLLGAVARDLDAPTEDRAHALGSLLQLSQRCGGEPMPELPAIVSDANRDASQALLSACCVAVARFGPSLESGLLAVLLDAATRVEFGDEKRHPADMAIFTLLSAGRPDPAIACLEAILRKADPETSYAALDSSIHRIATDRDLMSETVCRWLLTGEAALCAAARHLVVKCNDQRFAFSFDPRNDGWPLGMTSFVAKKAVGWLMPHATAPATFIACLLPGAPPGEEQVLLELLADPILVCYPEAARACLEAAMARLPPTPSELLARCLERHAAYRDGIEGVGFIAELQPTERQRGIQHRLESERFGRAFKEAREASALLSIFPNRTIMFGTTVVSYAEVSGAEPRRAENRLGTMRHTADNAMGWTYDPVGLELLLTGFRAEPPPR